MAKNKLGALVKQAGSEIEPAEEVKRGRGLAGMITEEVAAEPHQEATSPVDMSASVQDDLPTSVQDDSSTSQQEGLSTSPHSTQAEPKRPVKSFRLRDDLIYQIEVLAAKKRVKIYELVEEALENYLKQHRGDAA